MTDFQENLCVECDNDSTIFCKRCEVYVCEFHLSTHLNFKTCEICLRDTCDEMMESQGILEGRNDENVCFQCHAKIAFRKLGITLQNLGK
jgi:hypothetical protein